MVDVVLLGCGGSMPTPERFLSSVVMMYKGHKILIDCGEGTQVSMRMCNTGFKTIDVICISHIHGDHIVGLPGLLGTIGNSGRTEPIVIIGPEGITKAVNGLRTIVEWLPYEINIIENPKETLNFLDNEIEISFIEADYSSPCLGYSFYVKRTPKFDIDNAIKNNVPKNIWNILQKKLPSVEVDGTVYTRNMVMGEERKGIKMSFITDSRPVSEMAHFIKDSDLFICEGTYGSDDDIDKAIKNKHMTFREAATLAHDGNVKKLLLTHFGTAMGDPSMFEDNAREVFAETTVGSDRLKLSLDFEK
ncbi:ribonuclease Z [uncultured Clostridium sp.]|uniref:ribonuclease Z n=1 Tax=uncultured Clostridium sp. TaxID=59620 RepID=UPI0025E169F5|nr:ribonuclease Z [uncultured Clostridium sp.]